MIMKRLLLFLLAFIPFVAVAQFEAGEFVNSDTTKITGESIIYPFSDTTGQYHYSKMRDPSEDLDGVNLRTLFQRIANLDSLGLLVSDIVNGTEIINSGETQIYFPSAFDSNNVSVVPFVRRVSDDAVIDFSINDVDSLGFDIVVWDDNVKLSYIASQKISHSSDIFGEPIYSADSSYLKTHVRTDFDKDATNEIQDTTEIAGLQTFVESYSINEELDPIFAADSSDIVTYTGNDQDLDLGANSVIADTVKVTGLTTNYLPKDGGDDVGLVNSQIYDNGATVGINKLSPTSKLYISGSGGTIPLLTASNDLDATLDSTFTVLANGNVGVGTGDATYKLNIKGNTIQTIANIAGSGTGSFKIGTTGGSGEYGAVWAAQSAPSILNYSFLGGNGFTVFNMPANERMFFSDGNNPKMLLKGGNLIIKNNSYITIVDPSAKLHVESTTAQFRRGYDASNYATDSVTSTGDLVITPTGGDVSIIGDIIVSVSDTTKIGTPETNYTAFESDGSLVMRGDATVFNDINFDPNSSGGNPTTYPDAVTINGVNHWEFTAFNNQLCGDGQELEHGYKLGSVLYPHAHVFLKSGESSGTTGVTFTFYWELRQTTGTTSGSVSLSATSAQLAANSNKVDLYNGSFAGSAELGAQLTVLIARTGGDAGDVVLMTYGVHYEGDQIGSKTTSTK